MHLISPLTLLPFLFSLALAKNTLVTVGANDKLAFNPQVVTAAVGDTLTFSYFPKNHSVVQSSFTAPCNPLAGGFFSGFEPLSAGPGPVEFVVTVNDTKPIWIYCAQTKGDHCQMGMSMVVNQPAPPSPNTLDAYKLAAKKTNSTSPPRIAGGVLITLNSTSTSNATSTASSTGSGSVASSSGTSSGGSTNSSSGGSGRGSGSTSGSASGSGSSSGGSTTTSSVTGSSTSPISFQGAAAKFSSGITVTLAAAGIVLFALM